MYRNPVEAFREVERDLWEMAIDVHPQTMQDKVVADNPDYMTKEVQGYGFKVVAWPWDHTSEKLAVSYVVDPKGEEPDRVKSMCRYIDLEFQDRVGGVAMNPGNSYVQREGVWKEFLHEGKFSYTYSERLAPQLSFIMNELKVRPATRQAILNVHSNIAPSNMLTSGTDPNTPRYVKPAADLQNMGGNARIPCSMYYQLMIRDGKVDLIYTMRSCDFITHFPVDVMLALRLQSWITQQLDLVVGTFTYFTGSLHAYHKDLKTRGIF